MTVSGAPTEYEVLIANLFSGFRATFHDLSEIATESGARNRIRGASGYRHQIDVSLRAVNLLLLVECKKLKVKLSTAAVLALDARRRDIAAANPDLTVLAATVSERAVTRGASQLASYFGIDILRVASAREYFLRVRNTAIVGSIDSAALRVVDSASVTASGGSVA